MLQVAENKLRNGFACIRPPDHHAERKQAINNVSITVRHLQQYYTDLCKRIVVIDLDVHHKKKTQLCFDADSNVLYISLHWHDNENFYPGSGAVTEVGTREGKGFTVNIPFSGDIIGDAEYLAAWRVIVLPLLNAFKANFTIVSCGFSAPHDHPTGLVGYVKLFIN